MAELQRQDFSGEMTTRFHEFVSMQAAQIRLCLGEKPDGSAIPPQLPAARLFLDHLAMIAHKTAGNLSEAEQHSLDTTLATLERDYATILATESPRHRS